jgi:hypothetical protein
MLLTNRHGLHVNIVSEPPFIFRDFDIIDARHTLAHFALFFAIDLKSPVLKAIRSIPFPVFIMVLVEELDSLQCT